jgi:hypothetical protein
MISDPSWMLYPAAEEYEKLLKRAVVSTVAQERAPNPALL